MGDNEQKPQEQPKPPPPTPILNQVILAVIGLLLVLSPIVVLSGSGSLAAMLAKVLSGEPVLTSLGMGNGSAGDTVSPQEEEVSLPPIVDMNEVFRFDISPDWVVTRFPRVTTGLAILNLQGYRVPLVTGTAEDDLVGTITYYFDASRQVRRIVFEGTTGNPNRLLAFLATYYGFVYRPTNNPAVYLYVVPEEGSRGETHSYLWIRPRGILTSTDPQHRFDLSLVLERPER